MDEFFDKMSNELKRSVAKHGNFNSAHEALAVLWEEFEELKQEVFKQKPDVENMRTELIQLATMCLKFYNHTKY